MGGDGGIAKRTKATDCKSVIRGFESHCRLLTARKVRERYFFYCPRRAARVHNIGAPAAHETNEVTNV